MGEFVWQRKELDDCLEEAKFCVALAILAKV
jgi:hypothetical protein